MQNRKVLEENLEHIQKHIKALQLLKNNFRLPPRTEPTEEPERGTKEPPKVMPEQQPKKAGEGQPINKKEEPQPTSSGSRIQRHASKEVPIYFKKRRTLPNWNQYELWLQGKSTTTAKDPDACWNCGKYGHCRNQCTETRRQVCFRCGHPEVSVRTCPNCGPQWAKEDKKYKESLAAKKK